MLEVSPSLGVRIPETERGFYPKVMERSEKRRGDRSLFVSGCYLDAPGGNPSSFGRLPDGS
jgi:hypothetical protein